MNSLSTVLPFSEACERNKDIILETIAPILDQLESVLEIGSGTAQHAIHFAREKPGLKWQTSDQIQYLEGIEAQIKVAALGNVVRPFVLDVNQRPWCEGAHKYDAVYSANTFHIMTSNDVEQFFSGLPSVMNEGAYLIVYGPFKYSGKFTSESNRDFDYSLRSRECGSAIRDFEWVNDLADSVGLSVQQDQKMPANNQLLVWRYKQ